MNLHSRIQLDIFSLKVIELSYYSTLRKLTSQTDF